MAVAAPCSGSGKPRVGEWFKLCTFRFENRVGDTVGDTVGGTLTHRCAPLYGQNDRRKRRFWRDKHPFNPKIRPVKIAFEIRLSC